MWSIRPALAEKDENLIIDKDGNRYHTVTIGTQVWMIENLKTTKFNDGSDITFVPNSIRWSNLTTAGYCWCNNNRAKNEIPYGALYNYYAFITDKLCPVGWHIPNDKEWYTLMGFLGGFDVAGGKLKETGTAHWTSPNNGATNESGFTALPGGYRNTYYKKFYHLGEQGYYWHSPLNSLQSNLCENIHSFDAGVTTNLQDSQDGLSVSCIKDN